MKCVMKMYHNMHIIQKYTNSVIICITGGSSNSNSGHATPALLGTVYWVVMVLYRSANHRVVS